MSFAYCYFREDLLIEQDGNIKYEIDTSANYFMDDYEIVECNSDERQIASPNGDAIVEQQMVVKKLADNQNCSNTSTITSRNNITQSSENNFSNMEKSVRLKKSKNEQKQQLLTITNSGRNNRQSQKQEEFSPQSEDDTVAMSTTTISKTTMTKTMPHVYTTKFNQQEKNHVDLFFESVSSSVKALSPKLIAETKMRVSQLICELELRSLTENDNAPKNIVYNLVNPIPVQPQPQPKLKLQVPDNKKIIVRKLEQR